jgi:hypothetical protein
LGGFGLCGGNGAESDKERGVDTDGVIEESADDLLDPPDFMGWKYGGGVIVGGILYLGSISGSDPGVGGILAAAWKKVLKLVEHVGNVLGHRDEDKTLGIMPLDGEPTEQGTRGVLFDRVQLAQSVEKMVSMLAAGELDAKVMHDQGKLDGSGAVGPEGGCARNGGISVLGKMLGETVVGDATSLFEAWDALTDLHVYPSIGVDKVAKIVLEDDLVREEGDVHFHVLVAIHGSPVVEIFDVHTGEPRTGSRNRAVKEEFGGGERGTLGGCRSRVVETIATGTVADTMGFSFGGANGGLLLAVRNLTAGGDVGARDKKDGVGANYPGANPLGKATDVVGHAPEPKIAVGALDELAVVVGGTGAGVDDSVGTCGVIDSLGEARTGGIAMTCGIVMVRLNKGRADGEGESRTVDRADYHPRRLDREKYAGCWWVSRNHPRRCKRKGRDDEGGWRRENDVREGACWDGGGRNPGGAGGEDVGELLKGGELGVTNGRNG